MPSFPTPLVGMETAVILLLRHLGGTLTCESGERGRKVLHGKSGSRDAILQAVTTETPGTGI